MGLDSLSAGLYRLAWGGSIALAIVGSERALAQSADRPAATPGGTLYAAHCAGCHGERGDGLGVASRFLYPKPRDFRLGKFRLVSTANSVPTRDDLRLVLTRGMPGSSMPAWGHLPESARELLVDEVLRQFREGMADRYVAQLKRDEQLTDDEIRAPEVQDEIREFVSGATTAGEILPVPTLTAGDAAALARGREQYLKQSCHSCHGNEGKGDGVQKMVDDEGFATRPRDLTRGIYKGGHDGASVYRRILYGMPGTPMPASKNLTPEQTLDMVHYLLSLSTEEQRKSVILRREHLEVAQVNQLPTDDSDQAWSASKAVELQTFPLWWRDGAEPRLRVQALRNADTLAIRLQWRDASHDVELGQVDQFQDLVAVEWYQGETEPFLGMGSASTRVDLWQWRAGDPRSADRDSILDEYPFETSVYEKLARGQPLPDFRTARVSGNPLAVGTPSAGSLVAGGPSSTTFRPRASQVVEGRGSWRNGTWTVVLRRRLQVPEEAGLTVTQGSRYSVAFALWDGAARDRGPQKQVSVWHDLQVR